MLCKHEFESMSTTPHHAWFGHLQGMIGVGSVDFKTSTLCLRKYEDIVIFGLVFDEPVPSLHIFYHSCMLRN